MSRLSALLFAGLIAAGLLPTMADAREPSRSAICQTITDQQVMALFDRWNKSLASRNPDNVVANYSAEATLLPTVQNGPLVGQDAIRGYFVYFLKQAPDGRSITGSSAAVATSPDIGIYTFTLNGDQPNDRKQVKARYTSSTRLIMAGG